jgi:hypothetical protein
MTTYDDWKTTEEFDEEPENYCDECGHDGASECGCPCCCERAMTRRYRLADLAASLPDDERDAVHLELAPCAPQAWWDEFARRYPALAQDAILVTPTSDDGDVTVEWWFYWKE